MLEIIFALQVAVATILISVRTWDFLRLLAGASFKTLVLYRTRPHDSRTYLPTMGASDIALTFLGTNPATRSQLLYCRSLGRNLSDCQRQTCQKLTSGPE